MMISPLDDGLLVELQFGRIYLEQIVRDIPCLESFCVRNNVLLRKLALCDENYPHLEIVYVFNDGLGGYTIAGVRDSL